MSYDRNWLESIHKTWELIERRSLIDEVPFPHRPVIKQQFEHQVADFKAALAGGLNTEHIQWNINDLMTLSLDLIEETEKRRAAYASGATVFE